MSTPGDVERRFRYRGRIATGTPEGRRFAYVPDRALVVGELTDAQRAAIAEDIDEIALLGGPRSDVTVLGGRFDVVRVVARLRSLGLRAQPDHVLFAHGCCECGCGGLHGNPFHGNPFHGNPFHGNPFHGNPFHGNPSFRTPIRALAGDADLPTRSSAQPAKDPGTASSAYTSGVTPKITIIDCGFSGEPPPPFSVDPQTKAVANVAIGDGEAGDVPDATGDGWLDPIAGHGTFIAGLIEQFAPGCAIRVRDCLDPTGYGNEADLTDIIRDEVATNRPDILNLSLGGPVWRDPYVLASEIHAAQAAGVVVVASAGNDATCIPSYPAALPGVISVGALGPDGPAPFTNYGPWVRCCAPGVDLVSSFFPKFDGPGAGPGAEGDDFHGWARWSGTSFSAPMVVAALVREMRRSQIVAGEAVKRVIDAPHLARLPGLGTVVNL